jgi:ankyrin repeat protein
LVEQILKVGSIHSEEVLYNGWTPIQAAVCGTNENKAQYVQDMLDRNCKFQEKEKMQRPLIHAVKQGNKKLVRVLLQNGGCIRLKASFRVH